MLMVNFARPFDEYIPMFVFHAAVLVGALIIIRFARRPKTRALTFVRLAYPLVLMTWFYQFSGRLIGVVLPIYFDTDIAALEAKVLGFNPTILLQKIVSVPLTEILLGFYSLYYIIVALTALYLFFRKRDRELKRFVTSACGVYFVGYLIFIILPADGPRHFFENQYTVALDGPFFHPLVMWIMENAAFRGGAVPSTHAGLAVVCQVFAIRSFGNRGWWMLPVVLGIMVGAVYGRFHYVTDIVIGTLLALLVVGSTLSLYSVRREESRDRRLSDPETRKFYASHSD